MIRVTWQVALAAGLALTGCSKPQAAQQDAVVHAANGDIALKHGAAPANLPAYAPAYPGAQWAETIETSAKGSTGGIASFVTTDKPDAVIDFYDKAATKAGLTNKIKLPSDAQGTSSMMINQPGTQRSLTVGAGPNDNGQPGTKVSLAYGTA